MNIIEAKDKLKKNGYTWFQLEEFDKEFYKWLLPFHCNEEKNLKKYFSSLLSNLTNSGRGPHMTLRENFNIHEEALTKKNEILNSVKYSEIDKLRISQMWYYSDLNVIINKDEEIDRFKNYIKNLMMYFFDFDETQEYCLFAPMFTYYDEGCKLQNHSDGTGTGRICALLIYLNETYDEKDGGILVLNNNEKVIPTFGKVAIIDLQTFDIPHMVTEVTGGIGRYAILSFVKRKEDEFIHSYADRKKSLI
jgi:hypothetical protein